MSISRKTTDCVKFVPAFTVKMAAHAGPSNPPKLRKAKRNVQKVIRSGKTKKTSEKQRIAELENAAAEFVSRVLSSACTD